MPSPAEIREARHIAGLTQQQAGAIIGATRRAWQDWEAGRRNMPGSKWELFNRKLEDGNVSAEYKAHINAIQGQSEASEIRYSDTERGIKQLAGRAMNTWAQEVIFFRRIGFDENGQAGYDKISF